LKQENEELKKKVEESDSAKKEVEESQQNTQKELDETKEQLAKKEKELEVALAASAAESAVKDAALAKQMEDLKEENEELKKKAEESENAKKEAEDLEQQLKDAKESNMEQRDQIDKLEDELSETKNKLEAAEAAAAAATASAATAAAAAAASKDSEAEVDLVKRVFKMSADPKNTPQKIVDDVLAPADKDAAADAMAVVIEAPSDTFRFPVLCLAISLILAGSPDSVDRNGDSPVQKNVVAAYEAVLQHAYSILDPIVVSAFVADGKDEESNANARKVSGVVVDVQREMKAANVSQGVRRQLLSQLVHCVDASVFNALVSTQKYCTCQSGFNVRLAMGNFEGALSKDRDTFQARKQLQHVREVSNLFVMPKDAFSDPDAAMAAFSSLSISQVAQLLEYFHADEINQETVDSSILREVKKKATESGDQTILLDPHAWL